MFKSRPSGGNLKTHSVRKSGRNIFVRIETLKSYFGNISLWKLVVHVLGVRVAVSHEAGEGAHVFRRSDWQCSLGQGSAQI